MIMAKDITAAEGSSIVTWLKVKVNSKIDRGECWDAAEAAIKSVGASRPGTQLYVWGRVVPASSVQLGDILQFSVFKVKVVDADGNWTKNSFGMPRHTSVVSYINSDGSVDVLHQNYDNVSSVQSLEWVYLKSGKYGTSTVTVTGGTVTCYRPRKP